MESPDGGVSTSPRTTCPRCEAQLVTNYDERGCVQCGYKDYQYISPYAATARKGIINSATRDVLRYVGDYPTLADTLTYVRLQRMRNGIVYRVRCPFCGGAMSQSSLWGERRKMREERYKCPDGHRVVLTPDKHGALGWK